MVGPMKVRFRHFEYQPVFWRPLTHALRITLALTDTEHYFLARLGNANDPLVCYQIEDIEFILTLADCVAGVRLDFRTLLQANQVQNEFCVRSKKWGSFYTRTIAVTGLRLSKFRPRIKMVTEAMISV